MRKFEGEGESGNMKSYCVEGLGKRPRDGPEFDFLFWSTATPDKTLFFSDIRGNRRADAVSLK